MRRPFLHDTQPRGPMMPTTLRDQEVNVNLRVPSSVWRCLRAATRVGPHATMPINLLEMTPCWWIEHQSSMVYFLVLGLPARPRGMTANVLPLKRALLRDGIGGAKNRGLGYFGAKRKGWAPPLLLSYPDRGPLSTPLKPSPPSASIVSSSARSPGEPTL